MLSTRLFCNLGYRSCSTFSSVLTVGKKYPLADAKSKQSAEPDQDGHSVSVYDMKQDKQVDLSSNPPGCDEGLSNSYQQSGHEASDRREYVTSSKKYKGDRTKQWKTDEWREEGSYHRIDRNQSKQRKPWKHNRWDEQDSGQWDSIGTSWNKSGSAWDSCESQWHKLSKPSKKSAGQRNRPSHKVHHSYSQWDQNPNNMHLRKHVEDQPTTHSQSSPDQPPDRPRGKRLRKKEKLGFIESESAPVVPDAEQLLYGLHPVSLALAAGRREVRRVYHRADARASEGRLSRVLTECAVRGVGTVPLPAAQLDRIAGGTGVHQGVCARVTPLRPRSTDELLVQAGCPPLAGEPPSTTQVDGQRTSASNFWSVETDVMASEGESQRPDDTDRRLPVSTDPGAVRSETEPPVRDPDQEKKTEVSSPEATAISDRPAHRRRVWLMLDRVHDPMNFGSIIRSSYFLGVDAVIIPDKHRSVAESIWFVNRLTADVS